MLLQDAACAAPAPAAPPFRVAPPLDLPASIGFVEDAYSAGESAPSIVLIQDAHANVSGQLNVARALERILPAENIRTVFLEASDGDVSLSFLKKSATGAKRREIAARHLKSGWLQGSEYANVASDYDFKLWGVEDPALYEEGLRLYGVIADNRSQSSKVLAKLASTLKTLKPKTYNAALAAFDAKRAAHASGEMPFTEYAGLLAAEASRLGVEAPLDRLNALLAIKSDEARIDFAKAGGEQRLALASLDAARAEELGDLARSASRFAPDASGKQAAFARSLEEALGDAAAQKFPELFKYFAYLKKAQALEPKRMLEDIERSEEAVFAALMRTDAERGLRRVERNAAVLAKLVDLTLTPSEFERYRREGEFFDAVYLTGFLNRRIADLGSEYDKTLFLEPSFPEAVRAAEEFYDLTLARDRVFVERALAKMSADGERKSVLIAGGYHTPNLKRLLRENGVSYVSVTPAVTHETDRARYEKLLLEDSGGRPAAGRTDLLMVRHALQKARRDLAAGLPFASTALAALSEDIGGAPALAAALAASGSRPARAERAAALETKRSEAAGARVPFDIAALAEAEAQDPDDLAVVLDTVPPGALKDILEGFRAAGVTDAALVGGAVRDTLLGQTPADADFIVKIKLPAELKQQFENDLPVLIGRPEELDRKYGLSQRAAIAARRVAAKIGISPAKIHEEMEFAGHKLDFAFSTLIVDGRLVNISRVLVFTVDQIAIDPDGKVYQLHGQPAVQDLNARIVRSKVMERKRQALNSVVQAIRFKHQHGFTVADPYLDASARRIFTPRAPSFAGRWSDFKYAAGKISNELRGAILRPSLWAGHMSLIRRHIIHYRRSFGSSGWKWPVVKKISNGLRAIAADPVHSTPQAFWDELAAAGMIGALEGSAELSRLRQRYGLTDVPADAPAGARVRSLEDWLNGDRDDDPDDDEARRPTRIKRLAALNIQSAPYRFRDLDILNDIGADIVFAWPAGSQKAFAATGLKAEKMFAGSLPAGRSEAYHESLLKAAEVAAGAGEEGRAEMFLALRIAHKIMLRLANNANLFSEDQTQWHERAFQFAGAALKIKPDDPEVLKDYGIALIQTRRFDEAGTFFESIQGRNIPGGMTAYAAYKRRLAAERLEAYREQLEQKKFDEAVVLSQAAFQDMSDATNLLIGVTRKNPSGDDAAAAYAELSEIDRLRADFDVQSMQGVEMKGRDFVLSALRHMQSALRNVNRALAADTRGTHAKALDSASNMSLAKTVRVLKLAAGRNVETSKAAEYEALFAKLEEDVARNHLGFGRPGKSFPKTIDALIAETRERFKRIDELKRDVIEGMQIVAQHPVDGPDAAGAYFAAVETYLKNLYEKRPQQALDVLAELRARLSENAALDALDIAVIGTSASTSDISKLTAEIQKTLPAATSAEILGRWKAGRYSALGIQLTGIVTPKRREKTADTGYKRDPRPYSNATIVAAAASDPVKYAEADAIYAILSAWPLDTERERRATLMAGLHEDLKAQIDRFVENAQPFVRGDAVTPRQRDDLKELREGREPMSEDDLKAKLDSPRDEQLPYLPRLLYFRQLVDEEEAYAVQRVIDEADGIAAYRSKAASFASLFGFKLLDAHLARLRAIEAEIRRIGTRNGDLTHYLWYERFEALVEETKTIFEELDSLQFHAKVFGETRADLNRLSEAARKTPPVLSEAVRTQLQEAHERLAVRFANAPFERSARSVQRRAREIGAEARELAVRAERAAEVVNSFRALDRTLADAQGQFDDHRGAFAPGTDAQADAEERNVEQKLASLRKALAAWSPERVTLDNYTAEAEAWVIEKKVIAKEIDSVRAAVDAVRARKMKAIRAEIEILRRIHEWFSGRVKDQLYYHKDSEHEEQVVRVTDRTVKAMEEAFDKWLAVLKQIDQKIGEAARKPEALRDLPGLVRRAAKANDEVLGHFRNFMEVETALFPARRLVLGSTRAFEELDSLTGAPKPASLPEEAGIFVKGQLDRFGYPVRLRVYMVDEKQPENRSIGKMEPAQPASDDFENWLRRARSYLYRGTSEYPEWYDFEGLGPLPGLDFLYTLRISLHYYSALAAENKGVPITEAQSTLETMFAGDHAAADLRSLPHRPELTSEYLPLTETGRRVLDDEFKAHVVRFLSGAAQKALPDRKVEKLPEELKKRISNHITTGDREARESETAKKDDAPKGARTETGIPSGSRAQTAAGPLVRGFAAGAAAALGSSLFAGEAKAEAALLTGDAPESAVLVAFERGESGVEAKVLDRSGAELEAFAVERTPPAAAPRAGTNAVKADHKIDWKTRAERRAALAKASAPAEEVRPSVFWLDLGIFSDLKLDVAQDAEIFDAYVDVYAGKFLARPNGFVGLLNGESRADLASRAERRIDALAAKRGASGGLLRAGAAEPRDALRIGLLADDAPAFERDGRSVSFFTGKLESTSRGEAKIFSDAAAVADAMLGASLSVPAGKSVEDVAVSDITESVVAAFNDAVGADGKSGDLAASDVREILVDPARARRSPFSIWKLDWKQAFDLLRFVRSEIDRAA